MLTFNIGPLALPVLPLLMMASWWLAAAVADKLSARHSQHARKMAARALLLSAVAGLVAARVGFVALAWDAYTADPAWLDKLLDILRIRDGGWMPEAGWAAAVGVLGGFAWHYHGIRMPVAVGAAAGSALLGVASLALGVNHSAPLPALQLQSLEGRQVLLATDKKPTVISLWATWCPFCRVELPELAKAQQANPDVRFIFVNHGEDPAVVTRWLAQQPYTLNNVLSDRRMQLGTAIGSKGLPTTLFVDADGRIVDSHIGPLSLASLTGKMRSIGSD